MFGHKARWYVMHHAHNSAQPTYFYWFQRQPAIPGQTAGAYHSAEIAFVMGNDAMGYVALRYRCSTSISAHSVRFRLVPDIFLVLVPTGVTPREMMRCRDPCNFTGPTLRSLAPRVETEQQSGRNTRQGRRSSLSSMWGRARRRRSCGRRCTTFWTSTCGSCWTARPSCGGARRRGCELLVDRLNSESSYRAKTQRPWIYSVAQTCHDNV